MLVVIFACVEELNHSSHCKRCGIVHFDALLLTFLCLFSGLCGILSALRTVQGPSTADLKNLDAFDKISA